MSHIFEYTIKRLFVLNNADLQSTSDQQFRYEGMRAPTAYIPTHVIGIQRSGGATGTCDGGIYDAASKGGTDIVAASQSWLGISGSNKIVSATIEAMPDALFNTPYLSLTTGSTAACVAVIFIYGIQLD